MIHDTQIVQISQISNVTTLLIHWHQQCVTVHRVANSMSWHKVIVVITGKARCFHDYIYVTPIFLLWDLSTMCVVDHLWSLILRLLLSLLSTIWFIGSLLKYMSWLKAIAVITGRAHCFHVYKYIHIHQMRIQTSCKMQNGAPHDINLI